MTSGNRYLAEEDDDVAHRAGSGCTYQYASMHISIADRNNKAIHTSKCVNKRPAKNCSFGHPIFTNVSGHQVPPGGGWDESTTTQIIPGSKVGRWFSKAWTNLISRYHHVDETRHQPLFKMQPHWNNTHTHTHTPCRGRPQTGPGGWGW